MLVILVTFLKLCVLAALVVLYTPLRGLVFDWLLRRLDLYLTLQRKPLTQEAWWRSEV